MLNVAKELVKGPETMCSKCQLVFRERKRKPCPRCGGLPRTIQRTANDFIGAKDNAG